MVKILRVHLPKQLTTLLQNKNVYPPIAKMIRVSLGTAPSVLLPRVEAAIKEVFLIN